MLSNFIICINAVIPLMIYMVIGYIAREVGLITREEVSRFNHLVFVIFFGPLMFENLYSADITQAFNPKLIIYAVTFILCLVGLSIPIVHRIEPRSETRGAMIHGMYRSNFVLMGLPIAMNVFGKGNTSATAALIMVIVPLYNVLAVLILEYYRGGKTSIKSMLKKIATNPIILGAVTAIVFMALHIELPNTINSVVSHMSDATTPMALILLGASFDFKSVTSGKNRNLIIVVLTRLVIVPAVGLTLAVLLGFRGVELVSLLAMFAAPAAVSSYTMTESMGGDGELAGNVVIFTTPISCITLFLWLFLFKSLGMF